MIRTDTMRIPVIDGDTTVEIRPPWLMPPVTATYRPARLTDQWQQFHRSQYVADVRAGWARALAVLGVLGVAYFLLLMARGAYVGAELLGLTR